MKFIHLSDLHIGKRVHEYSMIEDQEHILNEIVRIIDDEKPNGVLIAGDIYDKSVPAAEAVQLFDAFIARLAKRDLNVFVISGNHDSPERIAFGSEIMKNSKVFLSPVYRGQVNPITLKDEYGQIDVYLLPFLRPSHVKQFYPDEEISSYTDAVRVAIEKMNVNQERRNILVTHQFVTGASSCESEEPISVGGSDQVDASVFSPFDFVALGHIHGPQNIAGGKIRYCGTPLKYSFSEVNHKKSVTVLEFKGKGDVSVKEINLTPKREMLELKNQFSTLISRDFYEDKNTDAYIHITLTDEDDIPDAIGKLRSIYPNIMKLDYDNTRTQRDSTIEVSAGAEEKKPVELFAELFWTQNNKDMTDVQRCFVSSLIEEIWGDAQ